MSGRLRIGVVGPLVPDSVVDNVIAAAEDLGHDVVAVGDAVPAVPGGRLGALTSQTVLRSVTLLRAAQKRLLADALTDRFDLLIVVNTYLVADVGEALCRRATKAVYWFPDAVVNLGRQSMIQIPYDAVFSKEPWLVRNMCDLLGADWYFLPEACNPRWHRPVEVGPPEPHVVVAGNYYPYRIRLLERLAAAGVPMRLFGTPLPRWMPSPTLAPFDQGRYLSREDKAREYRKAAAVLNIVHPSEIEGLTMRLFEAAGSGATVLTEPKPALDECFTPEREVLTFADFDELVDRVRWCLDHPDEARAIGDRAAERAHAEHTYAQRLTTLLETVGLA